MWLWLILSTLWAAICVRQVDRTARSERALLVGLIALLVVNGVTNGGLGDEANVASTLLILMSGWVCVLGSDVGVSGGRPPRQRCPAPRARRPTPK